MAVRGVCRADNVASGKLRAKSRAMQLRKTIMCRYWENARKRRGSYTRACVRARPSPRSRARARAAPPEGADKDWGCPRGSKCQFAHGREELRRLGDPVAEAGDRVTGKRSRREEEPDVSIRCVCVRLCVCVFAGVHPRTPSCTCSSFEDYAQVNRAPGPDVAASVAQGLLYVAGAGAHARSAGADLLCAERPPDRSG